VLATILVAAVAVVGAIVWLGRADEPSSGTSDPTPGVGPAGLADAGGFAYRFEVGKTYRYNVTTLMQGTLTVDGSAQSYREQAFAVISVRPMSVDDDGVVTAKVEQLSGRAVVNGDEAPLSPGSATVRIRPDGAIVWVSNPFGAAILQEAMFGFPGVNQFLPIMPAREVHDGDAWDVTVTQELPDVGASISFDTDSSLLGLASQSSGGDVVVVRGQVGLPLDVRFDARPALKSMKIDFPSRSEPAVVFSGSSLLDTTAEFDTAKGALHLMNSSGNLEMEVRSENLPARAGGNSDVLFSGLIGLIVQPSP
jgi:hypothetical protein